MGSLTPLERVEAELARYEHPLVTFTARQNPDGSIELLIATRRQEPGIHIYSAPLHPRDLDHPQFPWTFQRYLYDCLHDYLVEMFTRTPQMKAAWK